VKKQSCKIALRPSNRLRFVKAINYKLSEMRTGHLKYRLSATRKCWWLL